MRDSCRWVASTFHQKGRSSAANFALVVDGRGIGALLHRGIAHPPGLVDHQDRGLGSPLGLHGLAESFVIQGFRLFKRHDEIRFSALNVL